MSKKFEQKILENNAMHEEGARKKQLEFEKTKMNYYTSGV